MTALPLQITAEFDVGIDVAAYRTLDAMHADLIDKWMDEVGLTGRGLVRIVAADDSGQKWRVTRYDTDENGDRYRAADGNVATVTEIVHCPPMPIVRHIAKETA